MLPRMVFFLPKELEINFLPYKTKLLSKDNFDSLVVLYGKQAPADWKELLLAKWATPRTVEKACLGPALPPTVGVILPKFGPVITTPLCKKT